MLDFTEPSRYGEFSPSQPYVAVWCARLNAEVKVPCQALHLYVDKSVAEPGVARA